ncbi:hypothetical protein RRG08_008344 [Elysia crispata]|uniref:Uncharacterized protein n=1 Tax=Elysia crispata TaxID=231223 RepID=A0AAE1AKR9_9GAST|nr:hypothetical protein RRG08_008344 [Elysia crispata]
MSEEFEDGFVPRYIMNYFLQVLEKNFIVSEAYQCVSTTMFCCFFFKFILIQFNVIQVFPSGTGMNIYEHIGLPRARRINNM